MLSRRIIYAALGVLLFAASLATQAGGRQVLSVAGYQVVDNAVVVNVYNSGSEAKQGVVFLKVRIPGRSFATTAAVTVPAGATLPVAFEVPREWSGTRLKVDLRVLTDPSGGGTKAPNNVDNPHSEGNQITEGPDTVGG